MHLVISYCHHEISTFDLVFTRWLLVISCCYHEISSYNHVCTRYLLVISYCHHEISTLILYLQDAFALFRVVITKFHLSIKLIRDVFL